MSRELWKDFAGTYEALSGYPLLAMEFFETIATDKMADFETYVNPLTIVRREELAAQAEKALQSLVKVADVETVEYTKVLESIRALKKQEPIKEEPPIEEPIGEIKK